jgi:adenosylcobinamide-phosphate synthase
MVLAVAWCLDATLGEPPARIHPVVWMGWLIAPLKRMRPRGPVREFSLGAMYALGLTCGLAALTHAAQVQLAPWPLVQTAFEVYVLFGCFALRGLIAAGADVKGALARHDLGAARRGLASLCSRDASELEAHELAGAAIESLTENLSDSVVAPLFYYACLGLPGVVFYRAANTLDAMVGYHGRFEYLGKVAARLDDLLNLVPARLTALVLAMAGALLRLPLSRGASVWRADRARTESPNAGHPMAMAAGLLGVTLDKRGAYKLGQGLALPGASEIAAAERLTRVGGWLTAAIGVILLFVRGGMHGAAP